MVLDYTRFAVCLTFCPYLQVVMKLAVFFRIILYVLFNACRLMLVSKTVVLNLGYRQDCIHWVQCCRQGDPKGLILGLEKGDP